MGNWIDGWKDRYAGCWLDEWMVCSGGLAGQMNSFLRI